MEVKRVGIRFEKSPRLKFFGKFDEELSMTRLIESHNQQVKLLDQNRQLCLNLGSASMHAKELL